VFAASSSFLCSLHLDGREKKIELTQKMSDLIWVILFSFFFSPGSLIKIVSPLGSVGVLIFLGDIANAAEWVGMVKALFSRCRVGSSSSV